MQKQKSKNKLKPRELNRKGAEKEGTDMDAFVNTSTVPTTKIEIKQDKEQLVPMLNDNNKESIKEISKEQDSYVSKDNEIPLLGHTTTAATTMTVEKCAPVKVSNDNTCVQTSPVIIDRLPINKDTLKEELPPTIEDMKSNVCNTQVIVPNDDVVDHAKVKEEEENLDALIAQRNEENSKVLMSRASDEEKLTTITVLPEKENKREIVLDPLPTIENTPKPIEASPTSPSPSSPTPLSSAPQLKYIYKKDQWSPINTSGKKIYDRDFLMKLQFDPNSKIKPTNLPDLEVVLKDSTKVFITNMLYMYIYV